MSTFRRFVKGFRYWSPLWLWPLALVIFVVGVIHAIVLDDYARGAFDLILARILNDAGDEAAKDALDA